jgi:tetratricopeptide (TPR) repeat protein
LRLSRATSVVDDMKSRFLLLASIAALSAPAAARTEVPRHADRTAIADYVRARVADDLGELDVAATSFAAALEASPDDNRLALRTLRQAIAAGDLPLAAKTARGLDAHHVLPPDGTVLLAADALAAKDWKTANLLADRIQTEKLFAFLAPAIHAWSAKGGHGDPKLLDVGASSPLVVAYGAEHRMMMLVANGDPGAGVAALNALALPDGARAARLRIAAAATLQKRGKQSLAATVLTGDDPAIERARDMVAAGTRLPGAIDTAQTGIAELFARVAADVNHEQAGTLALEFARLSTMLAADTSEGWLLTASLLAGAGDNAAALAALGHVAANDPFIGAVRDVRMTLLTRTGRTDEALAEAQAATQGPAARTGDWSRYGDLLSTKERFADAAAAYARALELAGGDKATADVAWPLLLQRANAQLQAGDWPSAKVSSERALAYAPQQPALLNFLGYSDLEHGGDPARAAAMIAQAAALSPDDPSITDSLGWSWYLRGDLSKAIPLLEQAARGAPAESDINDHLGDAYWRVGRKLEARYSWRAALVVADPKDVDRIRAKIDGGTPAHP